MLQRIGRYEVLGEVARGGMGAVLKARDPQLGRDVAIKVLTAGSAASEAARRRFSTEGKALGRLKHPNIVAVHETGQVRDWPYIVMDFIDGESLDARIERDGPLPVDEAVAVAATMARALVHAHQQGIVHRDLKPGNVLLGRDGVVRLGDFGLAKDLLGSADVAGGMTRSGVFLGTPGFLPPEQAMGRRREVGPASDVYGLGATLYAALTGVPPYEADEIVSLVALMHAPPKPPSAHRRGIPAALDLLVLRCLQASPGDRPATMAAVADELEALRAARPASSHARRGPRGRRPSSAPVIAGALAIVAAAVAVGVALVVRRRPVAPPPPVARPPETIAPPPEVAPVPSEPPAAVESATATEPALLTQARAALLERRYDEALVLAEQHVAASPGDAGALELRGDCRLAVGDTEGALKDWSRAIDLDPDPDLVWRRANARKLLGDWAGAVADCGRVLSFVGPKREVLELRAECRAKAGDVDGALQDWTAAIGQKPTANALIEVAKLEFDQGHLEIALRDYTSAIQLDPDALVARINRSVTLQRLGRLEEAEAEASEAIALAPDNGYPWLRRGAVRLEQERWADALGDYDKAVAKGLEDDVATLLDRSSVLRALRRGEEALADAERAARLAPRSAQAHQRVVAALAELGRFEDVVAYVDGVLPGLDPSALLVFHRGVARDELGDKDGALEDYRASLALDPDQSAPHYNSGIIHGDRGDHAGAVEAYTKAIAHHPEAVYHLNRAEERRKLGDPQGALEDVNEALRLEPGSLLAHGARAVLHTRAGRYAEARPDWDVLVEADPKNHGVLYNRALCFEVLGERALAKADYEKVIEIVGPDAPRGKNARTRIGVIEKNGPPPKLTVEGDPLVRPPATEPPPATERR